MTQRQLSNSTGPAAPRRRQRRPRLGAAVERTIKLARLALVWERLWPPLWPVVGVIGLFVCVSLFGLWSRLPGWLHLLALFGFAAAAGWAGFRATKRFKPPGRRHAIRRIERVSKLDHRPLSTLEDDPSLASGRETRALWHIHQKRLKKKLAGLRAGWPSPGLVRHDPFGLRAVLGLGLIIGFTVAGPDWVGRIGQALSPNFASAGVIVTFEAWITPPEYTRAAPIFLTRSQSPGEADRSDRTIRVPERSLFAARVHGGDGKPRAVLGGQTIGFDAADAANYQIELDLRKSATIAITQGGDTLASWPIEVVPDAPPAIGFASPPSSTQRKSLKVEFRAEDDYGIIDAELRLWLAEPADQEGPGQQEYTAGEPLALALPVPSDAPSVVEETGYHDLTAHPWAGMMVTAQLSATDAGGQTGASQPTFLRLPERLFAHPVARELVDIRKLLVRDRSQYPLARDRLDGIAERPNRFNGDLTVYLGLRSAYWKLTGEPDKDTFDTVVALLWDLALRIEEGEMLLAERDLRRALEELQAALDEGASQEEIERLTDRVEDALAQFLRSLAENARNRNFEQAGPPDAGSEMIGSESLREMLDQLRSLNRLGARDAARDLLSDLRNILENLKAGPTPGQTGRARAMTDALRGIDKMMRDEQELIEETEDVAISRGEGLPEQAGQSRAQALAKRQQTLQQALDDAFKGLDRAGTKLPAAVDRADRAMDDAGKALERGNLGTALQAESEALDALQESANELARALAEATSGQGSAMGGNAVDPLGRPLAGATDPGDKSIVPKQWEIRRAREILEELQRRANQWRRPPAERDYIDRLLKRF